MEAEIRAMWLQTKGCQILPTGRSYEEAKKDPFSESLSLGFGPLTSRTVKE